MEYLFEKIAEYFSPNKNNTTDIMDNNLTIKEGYGYKRGAINTDWKKRLFVLNQKSLTYFKGGKSIPSGSIELNTVQHISDIQKDNIFKLFTPGRVYEIRLDSQGDAVAWVEALNQASKRGPVA
ncbi:Diacylglycerol kinase eta-like [Oopsacas minuta]|uniref:Diacylglycerol kinase eta-like n=1 Tax=Oopsacas minuta TaxID=111878 RepID=A0AAV7KCZ4_9METZ|nr:Diacylglycerol kinase eta-like [Oopsacas minuta]